MAKSDFVHLHVHTQYSLLDGACLLERLVDRAVQLNMPALAMTDHGNMSGAIKFYSLCKKKGIKPIIGCEVYVAPKSRFDREYRPGMDTNHHLILLAKDNVGYANLVKLVSLAHMEGFYYKPRVDKEILSKYNKGLIASTACLKGEVPYAILGDNSAKAYKLADEYLNIFGKGNFYLEIMENGMEEQKKINSGLIKMSKELDIPMIVTNDVHYIDRNQAFAHEVLLSIQTQTTVDDPRRFKFSSDTYYLRTPDEMRSIFKHIPQAVENTVLVAEKCNVEMDFSKIYLPHFTVPKGENEDDYLRNLCNKNINERYPKIDNVIKERLNYELGIISKMGFSSYFLIVWDLIKFSKENNIAVGPGRGSAAGSIVSYILKITDVDPLAYDLLFERFLNPARISMPDIDIDFCYENRHRVLEYVAKKYGSECVAQIITFGTMLAKAVIRDVGRALGYNYSEVDKIAKMIPTLVGPNNNLKNALSVNPELANVYRDDARIRKLIDVAMQLEGLSRHASTHAAGVVISDKPIMDRVPLTRGSDGEPIAGFDMNSLEKTGLLKMDFLGLKTLTVIEETLKIIKRTKNKDIDIGKISLKDKKTFSLLAKGDTIGVFQLESRGMRDILKKINSSEFEDLIAVLALYRPGPLGSGMVDDFIKRKQGTNTITYMHKKLEPILKATYGIMLYQEQIMQIVSVLAGFDMARADLLRKAIGKKIPAIMEEQRKLFIEGCGKNDISEYLASQIFDLIEYFSGYGFNKSHSTAYALISYRTAYLKANFPVEFMAALLTSERNNTDKVVEYVNESGFMDIKVLPPDINTSYTNFTVIGANDIRFGLMAIKNVGKAALESIIETRKNGSFESIFDFCERVNSRVANKKVVESLIRAGAMDSLGLRRSQMAAILDKILIKNNKKVDTNQLTLFSTKQEPEIPDIEEWPLIEILNFEKTLLGLYLTSHPLRIYSDIIDNISRSKIASLYKQHTTSKEVTVCGVIEKIKKVTTRRKNEQMAIIRIEDETAGIDVFIFPRLYADVALMINEGATVLLKGQLESKDKVPKILASLVMPIDKIVSNVKRANVFIEKGKLRLDELKKVFLNNKGTTPIYFSFKDPKLRGVNVKTGANFSINLSQKTLREVTGVVGKGNLLLTL